jgi:hypothetical protein
VNVSLSMLKQQLYAMRSWDSSGETQDARIRQALNAALVRMASDVPQALVPGEEHIVLYPDVVSTDDAVKARVITYDNDKRLLQFVDTAGTPIAEDGSLTTWRPVVTGEWDGLMHIEITDAAGVIHRRQCLEWFIETGTTGDNPGTPFTNYAVTLDRPYPDIITVNNQGSGALEFRIHQPEFFVDAQVMEVMEPARIFDGTRQQVWKIDTAGAGRQDMLDFQGNSAGRPFRCWRGRHFKLPAPTEPPFIFEANAEDTIRTSRNLSADDNGVVIETTTDTIVPGVLDAAYKWADDKGLRRGKWGVCYTYVLGRRDEEWEQSPSVTPGGDEDQDSSYGLTWAYKKGSVLTGENQYSGIHDPLFESAPSPITILDQSDSGDPGAMIISATNIDEMQGFGDSAYKRYGRSGIRIRYYVAHLEADSKGVGNFNNVETNERFYLLCEVEPTYDMPTKLSEAGTPIPASMDKLGSSDRTGGRIIWSGKELYDYHRPLNHSTGYYAWKVFPHQDDRYELDFRVSRTPRRLIDDADTAEVHPEAVPTLVELALYYVSLVDGNDQMSAQAHLERYLNLVRVFRDRYGNPGGIVEPVSILGYSSRNRYGTFSSSD